MAEPPKERGVDKHCLGTDRTVGASQAGAVLYRINGGDWHEFTGQTFTIADGTDIDLAYNDLVGHFTGNSEGNSGHYNIIVTRTQG